MAHRAANPALYPLRKALLEANPERTRKHAEYGPTKVSHRRIFPEAVTETHPTGTLASLRRRMSRYSPLLIHDTRQIRLSCHRVLCEICHIYRWISSLSCLSERDDTPWRRFADAVARSSIGRTIDILWLRANRQ